VTAPSTRLGGPVGRATREPPHNIDAEEAVVGCMLGDTVAVEAARKITCADDFYRPVYRALFAAACRVVDRGDPPDPFLIHQELPDDAGLTGADLTSLTCRIPGRHMVPAAARQVRDLARRRRLIAQLGRGIDAAYKGDDLSDDEIGQLVASLRPGGPDESALPFETLGTMIELTDREPPPRYLFRSVLAVGDYGMWAAEDKAGKTFAMLDAGVSAASGTAWFGVFDVEEPGDVVAFFGEGGRRKLVRRARAIGEARGVDLSGLGFHICLRAPHLTSAAAMALVEAKVAQVRPVLVLVDPLYLAAKGARGSDLYEMGAHLAGLQEIAQRHDAALLVSHHWNKTGEGRGAKRMSGVGPSAWGRMLASAAVVDRQTDPETKATTVTFDIDFQGDEIAEQTVRIRRRVWADDPNVLASPLHYEVSRVETEPEGPTEARLIGLRPSARRVLAALESPWGGDGLSVRGIGDLLANEGPLKVRTIQQALVDLREGGLVRAESDKYCATRAHDREEGPGK
jgi:hypothetical protein